VRHTDTGVVARNGSSLVSVTTFRLLKAYDPALFPKAAAELDRSAETLAKQAGGTLVQRRTSTVAGQKVREYRLVARDYASRLGFVLDGKREFQLLCRSPADADDVDDACAMLFGTFALVPA
jgi:hypothetical protein